MKRKTEIRDKKNEKIDQVTNPKSDDIFVKSKKLRYIKNTKDKPETPKENNNISNEPYLKNSENNREHQKKVENKDEINYYRARPKKQTDSKLMFTLIVGILLFMLILISSMFL